MELSKIALGCDSKPFKKGKDITPIMDECLRLGINVFDTARIYGKSEAVLGKYIRSHGKREDYYVISKGCCPIISSRLKERCLIHDLEKSLKTLNIGYIDLYLLHRDHVAKANVRLLIQVLNEYKKKGLIKAYGVSNWKAERVEQANRIARLNDLDPFEAVSNNFSLLPWVRDPWGGGDGCVSITGDQKQLDGFLKLGLPLFAYSPMGRGFVTGRVSSEDPSSINNVDKPAVKAYYSPENMERLNKIEKIAKEQGLDVADLNIAYLCNHPIKTIPVIGSTSLKTIAKDFAASSITLSEDIIKSLMDIASTKPSEN